jgi:hypothetical protein
MSTGIRIDGLDELRRAVDPARFARAVVGIRLGVAEKVRDAIARYPGPPRHPIRWASAKQKRWFFAALREGEIEAPYVRQSSLTSQRLGPSWAVAEEGRIVGTRVTYAPYVQSAEHQQPFHADTGWRTDRQAVAEIVAAGAVGEIARNVLRKFWR